ncbi:hypothetical protein [uncultured Duodenibacillus sp.]|uniref:hypothetical protein n=1 Tax=uncultured Duodenibacillus sp. TaxID=1980699 RepID=UPI00259391B6|nr:hypothetical protein [uncultured Duodenibacillus sp.]
MSEKEKRAVLGRPIIYKFGRQSVMLSLPTELVPVLRELGGSHWVRDRLREVVAEREKKEKQNQQAQKKKSPKSS